MARVHLSIVLLPFLLVAPSALGQSTRPATAPTAWLLHLPGIAGETGLDRGMVRGLRDGGFEGTAEIYDWTGVPGIQALLARKHNEAEADKVAQKITDQFRAAPKARLVVSGHSAGSGILVWALERLPDDVKVDDVLLLAPALSPTYDLSKALSRVRGRAYYFPSPNDVVVLGLGTALFGTVDGQKGQSAGLVGFRRPAGVEERAYERLVAQPYDANWMRFGNIGDHIGPMKRPFAAAVLTPLLKGEGPTTRPATREVSEAAPDAVRRRTER